MNRRSFLQTSLLASPAAGLFLPGEASAAYKLPPPPVIAGRACVVIDAVTGSPLFEKNPDEKRQVASTQKLMSALVAVETTKLDATFTVAASDTAVEPHKMYLKTGEQYPFKSLLYAMLIESCNDAAKCVGRNVAGSEEKFAEWMNRKAERIGMKNSHFANASGLPATQHSTARDMARLARAAIYNSTIRGIVGQSEASISRPDGRVKKLETTNYLLRRKSTFYTAICTGMKTGYTNAAGKCLISSGNYRGKTVICVMLGSNSKIIWKESRALLHWALEIAG